MENRNKENIYKLKWASGCESALHLTKNQIIKAINNWILKQNGWVYIEIINTKTNKNEVVYEDAHKSTISNISI